MSFEFYRVKIMSAQGRDAMKSTLFLFAAFLTIGCHDPFLIDKTPPNPPQGIRAVARDNTTQLSWLSSQEPDVAGYKVWVSGRYDGTYELLGKATDPTFTDYAAKNGVREY